MNSVVLISNLKRIAIFFLKGLITLGLFIYFSQSIVREYKTAKFARLNSLLPSFDYFIKTVEEGGRFEPAALKHYRDYFKQVTKTIEGRADAYGMLGFCEYYLGNIPQAIAAHQKAIKIKPDFFWFHYNLGMIYYKNNQYPEAVESFTKAIETNLDINFKFMANSKIYLDILTAVPSSEVLTDKIKTGYRDGFTMLVLSEYRLKNYSELIHLGQQAMSLRLGNEEFFLYYIGLALFRLNRYSQAVLFLNEALKINRESPDALYQLGLSLRALGKEEAAQNFISQSERLFKINGTYFKMIDSMDLRAY